MGITLDTNMYLLCSLFNISYKKISNEYSGMTVEQIMEAEAAQGNRAAANFDKSVLSDPVKLIQLFQLNDPGNKYAILNNMNEQDLDDLLPLLDQSDLVAGLNFFNKDKLLKMAGELPKEQLIKFTGQMFSAEQIMQYLPEEQLNNMLRSTDMDKQQELKYLQTVNPQIMAQMLEAATGEPAPGADNVGLDGQPQFDKAVLFNQLSSLQDDKFQDAMLSMPQQAKRNYLLLLCNENPKLYSAVDSQAYINIINNRKEKDDIVKSANVLDQKQLVKMVEQLPKDLTAVVLTQVDTKKFADVLLANFKNILSQVIAG